MATYSFADLSATYPQLYRELRPQIQRKAPTARLLPWKPVSTGQNIGWDLTFDGQVAAAVNPDGGNLLTAAADPRTAATLGFGAYSAPVKVTTKAQWTGAAIGVSGYDFLKQMIDQNTSEAVQKLVKKLNQDIFAGSGSSNQMTGLSSAIAASGTYANVSASTYANWASYASGNSGTLRSLTLAMIKTAASTIATNSPSGRPDIAIVTGPLMNAIENLFDGFLHLYGAFKPGAQAPAFPNGPMGVERVSMNPATIQTAGGQILRSGFRALYWENADMYFVEDPDCTNTALTNQNNCIYFMNSAAVEMNFLPPASVQNYMPDQKVLQATEQDLGSIANLQFDFRSRGRTTFADEFDLLAMTQVVVKDRASTGILYDVQ